MIHNNASTNNNNKNKSTTKMIDPSLRRMSGGTGNAHRVIDSADLAVSPNASGVEKLLAASGLSAIRHAPPGTTSSSAPKPPSAASAVAPSLPDPSSSAAAANAAAAAASLAGSLPILSLIARASAASNFAAGMNQGPTSYQHSLHSAAAVNNALSSIAQALTSRNVGGIAAMPPQDLLALSSRGVPAAPSSLPTSSSAGMLVSSAPSDAAGADAAIRQEQITAALKSKPQRGRKRENLNDYERMELTRTRNREHAKSTRIRKKARHEELLEMEHKFKVMADEEAKKDLCKELVTQFFALRTRALDIESSPGAEDDADDVRLVDIMDEKASFVFDGSAPTKSSTAASISTSGSDVGESRTSTSSVVVKQLESFDELMRTKATRCLGQAVIPMLSYSVQGGKGGIALSKTHSAYCRVDLMLARSLLLVRGIATFDFAVSDSPVPTHPTGMSDDASSVATAGAAAAKITSVQWIPIHDVTVAGALESIDPIAIVAMAAESAESLAKARVDQPGRLTASSISRHNANHHDSRATANVSSSSCSSSVVASSKEEAGSDGGDGDGDAA